MLPDPVSAAGQLKILIFYVAQIFVAILYMVLYHSIYKDSSRLLTNNASFLLLIGYIMLTRLNFNLAVKQFIFATVGLIITAFIPYIMLKWKKMKDCGVLYGVIGLLFLLTVFIPGLGSEKYGSRNWINLGHLSVQPMEFVKILFVFFVASMLVKASTFKELFVNALISAAFMGCACVRERLRCGSDLLHNLCFDGVCCNFPSSFSGRWNLAWCRCRHARLCTV